MYGELQTEQRWRKSLVSCVAVTIGCREVATMECEEFPERAEDEEYDDDL
jgi:hypothetical protein